MNPNLYHQENDAFLKMEILFSFSFVTLLFVLSAIVGVPLLMRAIIF